MTGEEIKKLRKKLKLTQTSFGEKIGVAQSTVRCWELGLRNPSKSAVLLMEQLKTHG